MSSTFIFHAKDKEGRYHDGTIEAWHQDDALGKLESQGLFVISLRDQNASASSQVTSSTAGSSATSIERKAQIEKIKRKISLSWQWSLLAVASVVLLLVTRIECDYVPRDGKVDYKILQADNLTKAEIRIFRVSVNRKASRGAIKLAAKQLFAEDQKTHPSMKQAMFEFFFTDQNLIIHQPIATLRYNWDNSNIWEETFSFSKGDNLTRRISVEQKTLKRGQYVLYHFTIPQSYSPFGGQKQAEEELKKLRSQWQGQVATVEAELSFEFLAAPFMTCIMQIKDGSITCGQK
jgi:hypothetical protein